MIQKYLAMFCKRHVVGADLDVKAVKKNVGNVRL